MQLRDAVALCPPGGGVGKGAAATPAGPPFPSAGEPPSLLCSYAPHAALAESSALAPSNPAIRGGVCSLAAPLQATPDGLQHFGPFTPQPPATPPKQSLAVGRLCAATRGASPAAAYLGASREPFPSEQPELHEDASSRRALDSVASVLAAPLPDVALKPRALALAPPNERDCNASAALQQPRLCGEQPQRGQLQQQRQEHHHLPWGATASPPVRYDSELNMWVVVVPLKGSRHVLFASKFCVRKRGFAEARRLALASYRRFLLQHQPAAAAATVTGAAAGDRSHAVVSQPSMFFSRAKEAWCTQWYEGPKRVFKSFSCRVYGRLAEPLCRWFLAVVRRHGRRPSSMEVETQCVRLRSLALTREDEGIGGEDDASGGGRCMHSERSDAPTGVQRQAEHQRPRAFASGWRDSFAGGPSAGYALWQAPQHVGSSTSLALGPSESVGSSFMSATPPPASAESAVLPCISEKRLVERPQGGVTEQPGGAVGSLAASQVSVHRPLGDANGLGCFAASEAYARADCNGGHSAAPAAIRSLEQSDWAFRMHNRKRVSPQAPHGICQPPTASAHSTPRATTDCGKGSAIRKATTLRGLSPAKHRMFTVNAAQRLPQRQKKLAPTPATNQPYCDSLMITFKLFMHWPECEAARTCQTFPATLYSSVGCNPGATGWHVHSPVMASLTVFEHTTMKSSSDTLIDACSHRTHFSQGVYVFMARPAAKRTGYRLHDPDKPMCLESNAPRCYFSAAIVQIGLPMKKSQATPKLNAGHRKSASVFAATSEKWTRQYIMHTYIKQIHQGRE
ncbi:uncharacterized protein LOC34617442 [Cyclospora cayetanensis]|uniref:Uncharacterized protein LOC34617442 n=1 Tax=Cyclospora cayetanensis TaxID=88456 RepID=A0A6P6RUV5_9EIME|nr:uncharacterized protein LOC34617442 [Cyclospora cayetanensis]